MALLELALSYTLVNEGSSVVDDPSDRGGLTRYGITQKTLGVYLGREATREDVIDLNATTVEALYRKLYWSAIKGDGLESQPVATVYFDMAVLMGPSRATALVQKVVGAQTDGLMGPKTLAAVNAFNPSGLLAQFSSACCGYFSDIVARDTSQAKWMPGWTKRAHRMLSLLNPAPQAVAKA